MISNILFTWTTKCFPMMYSALQKNWTFWGFSYKMPIHARVENYLNVMINAPIFAQLFALMWGTILWALVPKFPMSLELQAMKFESTKKVHFSMKFVFSKLMACDSKTIGNFGTKTYGIVPHINANNWTKIGAFTITFR